MKQNVKHECDSSTLPLPPVFIVHHADQLVQLFSHIPWNRWLVRTNYTWFSSITFQSDVNKRVKCTCSIRQQAYKLEDVEMLGKVPKNRMSTCHGLQCGRRISTFLLLVLTLFPHLALLAGFSPAGLNITLTLFTNQSAEPQSWLSHKTQFKWKRIELKVRGKCAKK